MRSCRVCDRKVLSPVFFPDYVRFGRLPPVYEAGEGVGFLWGLLGTKGKNVGLE